MLVLRFTHQPYAALISLPEISHNVTFIQNVEPHPWNVLRALKNTLAPSDQAQSLEVDQRYRKLCKGPGTQDLEAWLDESIEQQKSKFEES